MTLEERQAIREDLIRDEGLKTKPYRCPAGKLTIGVGRNLDDVGLSEDEALYLLDNDIRACQMDLRSFPWFSSLDPIRQRVLINLRFNLGPTRFRGFTKMLHALAGRDYEQAAAEMAASKWSGQVGDRAKRLVKQMRTGKP